MPHRGAKGLCVSFTCRLEGCASGEASVSWESTEGQKRRRDLWLQERDRQAKNVARIEKVEIGVSGREEGERTRVVLNKGQSTPATVAKHLDATLDRLVGGAVVEELDAQGNPSEESFWDLHRPFQSHANMRFQYYEDSNHQFMHALNMAYWRSCSFVLGAVVESAFKAQYPVTLHSWPGADYRSGSFVYDAQIQGLSGWTPTQEELHILGRTMLSALREAALPLQPLVMPKEIALQIFADNPFKSAAIKTMRQAGVGKGEVKVYRMGDHVDVSEGPLVPDSAHFGNFAVTKVEECESDFGTLHRFQGVSVPAIQRISTFTWNQVRDHARKTNRMPYPSKPKAVEEAKESGEMRAGDSQRSAAA